MKVDELLERAQDTLSGRQVFGEAIRQDGVTVIPAANIAGGGGGGGGHDEDGQEGAGGGFGFRARPAGVYLIDNGEVRWRPAVDVDKLALTLATVVIVRMLVRWRIAVLSSRTTRAAGVDTRYAP